MPTTMVASSEIVHHITCFHRVRLTLVTELLPLCPLLTRANTSLRALAMHARGIKRYAVEDRRKHTLDTISQFVIIAVNLFFIHILFLYYFSSAFFHISTLSLPALSCDCTMRTCKYLYSNETKQKTENKNETTTVIRN